MNLFDAYDITRPLGAPPARRPMTAQYVDLGEISEIVRIYLATNYPDASRDKRFEAQIAAMRCAELGAGLDGALDCATNVMRDVRRGRQ